MISLKALRENLLFHTFRALDIPLFYRAAEFFFGVFRVGPIVKFFLPISKFAPKNVCTFVLHTGDK